MTSSSKLNPHVEADLSNHTGQTKACYDAWMARLAKLARKYKKAKRPKR